MVEKEAKKKEENIAHELAKKQREISIAEFFEKNRHLLGFDNKKKALLTTIKEAVDNALDACEEANILPEINVEIIDMQNDRYRIIVEDNGPGIVKDQIPKIFAKLLYGSKFHTLKQARGQQGIGISAAVLYAQLTTGRPAKIISKIGPNEPAHYYELRIDTQHNHPEIVKEDIIEWKKEHGTKIEMDIDALYQKGDQSVDEYIKETAIINPHATIIYTTPKAEQLIYTRATNILPILPKEVKPHPYGVELGMLIKLLKWTNSKTLFHFLTNDFSRVGPKTAKEICEKAAIPENTKPTDISMHDSEKLIKAIRETKIMAPSTDCIAPIGAELLEKSLRKEVNAEFYVSTTRPPSVYRGNPFIIECAIAYGGELPTEGPARVMRYANRVPLLYQQGACAITKSIITTNWKAYGLQQSGNSLPIGPIVIIVHLASVWAPFTSEAKEAIAHYPEIIKEMKLALQECGRKLYLYVGKKRRLHDELKRKSYIEIYIPYVAEALKDLLKLDTREETKIKENLKEMLERKEEEEVEEAPKEVEKDEAEG